MRIAARAKHAGRDLEKSARLQGRGVQVQETSGRHEDAQGNIWKRCIFTVEITNFSMRTPDLVVPDAAKGTKVKLVRWCCQDWHYKLGIRKTLTQEETEAVLKGRPTTTVFW